MVTSSDRRLRDEIGQADFQSSTSVEIPGLTPRQCWDLISDSDLVKRAVGHAPVIYERVPVAPRLSRLMATALEAVPEHYEVEHYQWDEGRWICGRQLYVDGPLARFTFFFAFGAVDGHARLEMAAGLWARDPANKGPAQAAANGMPAFLHAIVDSIVVPSPPQHPEFRIPAPLNVDKAALKAAERALLDCGESAPAVERLVHTVAARPDHELLALEPRQLADTWGMQRSAVTDLFLRAARIGLVQPEWSVICPSCRGPKGATQDVAKAAGGAHCEDCNITFDADPTTNLQLTFRPSLQIRTLAEEWRCVSGPARTPHIRAQKYSVPSEREVLSEVGAKSGWRLRCPVLDKSLDLTAETGVFRLDAAGFTRTSEACEGIEIINDTSTRVRVLVEEAAPRDSVLRACDVLAEPRYRELFRADQWEFLATMERAWRSSFDVPQMRPVSPTELYDLIVIGSGPAGESAALRAAQLGRRVAVVEARRVFGGSSGLPSKAFREAALKVLDWSKSTSESSERLRQMFEERFAHLRRYVQMMQSHEVLRRLGRANVDLYYGVGSLLGPDRVKIVRADDGGVLELSARHVVVATGSRPARPESFPFDGSLVLDAEDMNELRSLPKRMCIVGFGVIGGEYASLLAALGVSVTAVHTQGPVLPMLDREVADAFCAHIVAKGVRIVTGAKVVRVEKQPGATDPVRVFLDSGEVVSCDQLLYSQGRDAATANLNLEAAGVSLGRYGRITVDGKGRTSSSNVLAAGDVIGPPGLASAAVAQGRGTADLLFGRPGAAIEGAAVQPTALWTLPEVAGVGLTEAEAKARGVDFVCGYGRFRDLPRGILAGDLNGWAKLIVDRSTLRILGAHVIGDSACDLIQHAVMLIRHGNTAVEAAESGFSAATFHNLYEMAAQDALQRASERPS